jgi:hypothetical protein
VYGCLIEKDQHDFQAYPHVPSLKRVQWFPGLRDLKAGEYPSSFTVVPILVLDTATFAQIIYTGRNETHLGLCKKLIEFDPESGESVTFFRRQPRLVVIGGETEVPPGWLDVIAPPKLFACITEQTLQPPRVALNVLDVGPPFMLNVVFLNSDENRLHEDPRRVGPSNFTRGQRPSGFSSVIKSHSTTPPKSLTTSQLKKKRNYDKALDNQNPSNRYWSGRLARSTTSDQQTKWWLDDQFEEKPGVTPANAHLAKPSVKTHIFSREEMEAFAEERLRAVKDIDEKKDFLDIIKLAMALKSSLVLATNHVELQKGTLPLGLFIPAIPYSDQELVNLSCLVDRGREFEVDTEYESRNKFAIRVDLYQLNPKRKLKSYLKKGSKDPPARPLMIAVYKDWLKQYLDWFDPDMFEYISAHAAGMKVLNGD